MSTKALALAIVAVCLCSCSAEFNGRGLRVATKRLTGGRTYRGSAEMSSGLAKYFSRSDVSSIVSAMSTASSGLTSAGSARAASVCVGEDCSSEDAVVAVSSSLSADATDSAASLSVSLPKPSQSIGVSVPEFSDGSSSDSDDDGGDDDDNDSSSQGLVVLGRGGRKLLHSGLCDYSSIYSPKWTHERRAKFTVNTWPHAPYYVVSIHYYYDCNWPWGCTPAAHVVEGLFYGPLNFQHWSDFDYGLYTYHQVMVYGHCRSISRHRFF